MPRYAASVTVHLSIMADSEETAKKMAWDHKKRILGLTRGGNQILSTSGDEDSKFEGVIEKAPKPETAPDS